jgi:hypothetical protein
MELAACGEDVAAILRDRGAHGTSVPLAEVLEDRG